MSELPDIKIPRDLLPADGRFGCGPSKVRRAAVDNLAAAAPTLLGYSHRKATVKSLVGRLRDGLRALYELPDGYEVVLGNGGTTVFWDALTFGFIENKSQHLSFGEFSNKFAKAVANAPFLDAPEIIRSDIGTHPLPIARNDIDTYAFTHNETSTGVVMQITRPPGANSLVAVDATSAAGGMHVDTSQFDCYYFAPQKCFASDGGLWIALLSPAALERIEQIEASKRWIPESIRISTAIANSRQNTTYNTPALATIFLAVDQLEWINNNGGLNWSAAKSAENSRTVFDWVAESVYATPFVVDEQMRSPVVATIEIDNAIDATTVSNMLAANGIVDTHAYGKLDRNQLRIATFPSIEASDLEALTHCIDFVVSEIA